MDPVSLNPQAAFGSQMPMTVGAAQGARQAEPAQERPEAPASPPSSTYVTISGEGRSRLAEDQTSRQVAETALRESATVTQNTPVLPRLENVPIGRAPNSIAPGVSTMTAASPLSGVADDVANAGVAVPAQSLEAASVQTAVPAASAAPVNGAAPSPAAAPENPTAAQAPGVQDTQQQARRMDVAQSLQDRSPALGQSGLTDNREVFSA